ncbi:hypothetical protein GCM10008995_07540 [Halobellus salinus]|uniref:DUF7308 domain-containing protein n=1 Tax=Halobellus salinus TaxID=931585 RepID=A0A830ELA7_9EURY|nr:hypothetical protein [Halobellus salinus]GGJ00196.1 hypothetical protein GCM10008995_07540 [Halobellus salinus]SMP01875.1 hypothetical protein SAMN06265347_101154 [Halobellus salinus]
MTARAVSSNLGLVLLLALTVVGAGVVVGVGGAAFDDIQHRTSVDRAEHAITLLDARTAVVGLGEGSTQTVRLGRTTSGDYAADSDTGWLRITHTNYTANRTETVYNASLGSVSYRTGSTTVAYQGGGVWRRQAGGTSMVSSPEFHYRGTTLTLPVLRVRSDDAAAGETTATVERDGELTRVYPADAAVATDGPGAPYDANTTEGSIRQYDNPVRNGTVSVTVKSEYYEGWAEYFRTRTTGTVSVDNGNRTATVVLGTADQPGAFRLPDKNEGVAVRGVADGHSVETFETSIRIGASNGNGGTANNLYFSYYVEAGDDAYEVFVATPTGIGGYCTGGGPDDVDLRMDVYYHNDSTAAGVHHWTNDTISSVSGPVQLACSDGAPELRMAFTSPEQSLTYDPGTVDRNGDTELDWASLNDGPAPDPTTFGHTGDDNEHTTYESGDEQNSRILTRHYLATFDAGFTVRVNHGPGGSGSAQINQANSDGVLRYDTSERGSYLTYLYVTENNVTVELH